MLDRLPLVIQRIISMKIRIKIVAKMATNPTGEATVSNAVHPRMDIWAQDQMYQCIETFIKTPQTPSTSDIDMIISALVYLDEATISARFTSIFAGFTHVRATAFLLGLLSWLKTPAAASHLPNSGNIELFRSLSVGVFNRQKRLSDISTPTNQRWAHRPHLWAVTPHGLVQFACDLNDFQSTDGASLIEPFIQEINVQCTTFPADDMRDFWMPFLFQLIPALVSRSVALNIPVFQQLTRQFIEHLDNKVLGPCPSAPVAQDQLDEWRKLQKELYSTVTQNIQHENLTSLLGDEQADRVQSLAGLT
ncbi:hypothetical protein PGT21_006978 [Puccinia graminis f. sp. tritici]|uniref:Uncharacterized protein n=1 Tax=Puccinia graminis f. sp. tritici TaxID=56615 RepID=A0A5B0MT34_PUCGR|nr:hypothetical protein PGT21_006978 [Puccinia graminis f. sp. tritici]